MSRLQVVPIDLNKLELLNPRAQQLSSDPGTPVGGQWYYNTADNTLRFYNTSAFIKLGRLDQITAPTASVDLNSQRIINLATPSASTDATTKAYVDSVASGLDVKQSARIASTANISGTYSATGGAMGRGQFTAMSNAAIDGVTPAANDRVLMKDQTTGAQNGIWVITTLGTGANGVWDRATDFDQDAEVTAGAFVFVEEGTTNGDSGWVLTTNNPITIGGSSGTTLAFSQFSGAGQITAGAGLTKTGNTLDVIAGASPSSGGPGGGLVVAADSIAIDKTIVPLKYSTSVGDGAALTYNVDHNIGTLDVQVAVYRNSDGVEVFSDITRSTTNRVIVGFSVAPTSNQYRVVVIG